MKAFLILVLLLLSGCGGSNDTTADSKPDPFHAFLDAQKNQTNQ
jgi:hypothetical protein